MVFYRKVPAAYLTNVFAFTHPAFPFFSRLIRGIAEFIKRVGSPNQSNDTKPSVFSNRMRRIALTTLSSKKKMAVYALASNVIERHLQVRHFSFCRRYLLTSSPISPTTNAVLFPLPSTHSGIIRSLLNSIIFSRLCTTREPSVEAFSVHCSKKLIG